MAKGDIVNATFSGGTQNFQPASGVEIMITYVGGNVSQSAGSGGSSVGLTDGTNIGRYQHNIGGRSQYGDYVFHANTNGGNLKIGVTNSVYLSMACSGNASYSGIQTK